MNDQLPFTPIDLGASLSIGDVRVETLGAARAGVELLVLTHLSDPDDEQPTCEAARSQFTSAIEFACPGMRLGRAGSRTRVMARED